MGDRNCPWSARVAPGTQMSVPVVTPTVVSLYLPNSDSAARYIPKGSRAEAVQNSRTRQRTRPRVLNAKKVTEPKTPRQPTTTTQGSPQVLQQCTHSIRLSLRFTTHQLFARSRINAAKHGHLTTGISAQVGASILTAGKCALAVTSTEDTPGAGLSTQFVVAARPGTGKASHAHALMMAVVPRC